MTAQPTAFQGRERLSLNRGWRFHLGDIPFPVIRGHPDSYSNAKAGRALGAAAPEHDDTAWRTLDLPHDWGVEGPFDPTENLSQGYRQRGYAWYRRHFPLSPQDRGRHLELQFDGIATHCTVWINGTVAHRNWCGYTSFSIDITPLARFGDDPNHIAIRVDANAMEGWWYEGAGIYRHTWLVKRDRIHIVTDGVSANPVHGAGNHWHVPVEVTVGNSGAKNETFGIECQLLTPNSVRVAQSHTEISVQALGENSGRLRLDAYGPRLWTTHDPALYTMETTIRHEGRVVDQVCTPCGFRTLRFDANEGFFLNGQRLQLKGVCCHQDHAGVGVAVPDALWEFRLRKLKEMGVNAYRCSHNPPSAEFLDLCDRMGILVMNENRHFNCTPEYLRQLEWLVRRDRNHPCVFLWSVFNEEPMQGTEVGYEMVRRMVATVKKLDTTRPVTAAMNGGLFAPVNVAQAVDVVGFNYQIESYDRFHAANPGMALTSSEDTSAYMTRGEFKTDRARNVLGSDDSEFAPWGASHRGSWRAIAERPYLAGGFVWTGFDYRGEPTPLHWPSTVSFFGCMDLCGFPKTAFYIHQAHWEETTPVLHLTPHWNWKGREGEIIEMTACTNAETVALFLNGEPLGEKQIDRFDFASWKIPYVPGRLIAVGKRSGLEIVRTSLETTSEAVALRLTPDRSAMLGDGWDAQPITVSAVDAQGRPVPTSNARLSFKIAGPGTILGHGNGDPNSHELEKGSVRSLFNGLAQVILQSLEGKSGTLSLEVESPGLVPAQLEIIVKASSARPSVPIAEPKLVLERWRISPGTTLRPDPNQEVADNDMNTWAGILPGDLQTFAGHRWAIYRVHFLPFQAVQAAGGMLTFRAIAGKAEVWLDGTLLGTKAEFEVGPMAIRIPARRGERTLSVLIEAEPGGSAGLGGAVTVGMLAPAELQAADEDYKERALHPSLA